jgi:hypothetical protein
MSAQAMERIYLKGKELDLATMPLRPYLLATGHEHDFTAPSTICSRGYIGTWELRHNRLYLIAMKCYLRDSQSDMSYLFPNRDEVFASWFDGELRIPEGELLEDPHQGFGFITESEIILTLHNGCVDQIVRRKNEVLGFKMLTHQQMLEKTKPIVDYRLDSN